MKRELQIKFWLGALLISLSAWPAFGQPVLHGFPAPYALVVLPQLAHIRNCVYKLRRAAELLTPTADFFWLAEIEKDLALIMEPRSKFNRLVYTGRLLEVGLTLVAEAQGFASNDLARARGVRTAS
jgi:hypothetical protein